MSIHQALVLAYDPDTRNTKLLDLTTGKFVVMHRTSFHSGTPGQAPVVNTLVELVVDENRNHPVLFRDLLGSSVPQYGEGRTLYPGDEAAVLGPVIFLAGPIQGAFDWHSEAITWIRSRPELNHVTIATPRSVDSNPRPSFEQQVDWESRWLNRAAHFGVVMFWLAREAIHYSDRAYAQTSRWELSEWKERLSRPKDPLVVGIQDGFFGARYMKYRLSQSHPHLNVTMSLM